jgi:hypothetical protein
MHVRNRTKALGLASIMVLTLAACSSGTTASSGVDPATIPPPVIVEVPPTGMSTADVNLSPGQWLIVDTDTMNTPDLAEPFVVTDFTLETSDAATVKAYQPEGAGTAPQFGSAIGVAPGTATVTLKSANGGTDPVVTFTVNVSAPAS